ncbi:hypothetical protein [Streptomyces longisporus]|uniref:Uncharacterized protein n=1 Tax=Streptomyces longisporus TaxID=1948 RepID=A0ABN3LIR1_STRLO
MVLGDAETFTAEQFADLPDVNVLRTPCVNRAAPPKSREQGPRLLVRVGGSSARGS